MKKEILNDFHTADTLKKRYPFIVAHCSLISADEDWLAKCLWAAHHRGYPENTAVVLNPERGGEKFKYMTIDHFSNDIQELLRMK